MQLAGAIIAGGQGRRMGVSHKSALLLPDGNTPAQRLATTLAAVGCEPVVIVANQSAPYASTGLRVIADRRTGFGPLAGIEAALLTLAPLPVCIVAGDMPNLGTQQVQRLIAGWDGRLAVAWTECMQPLCALVASTLVGEVSLALDRAELGVYRLWERLGAVPVRFADAAAFADLDTPEDLARFH